MDNLENDILELFEDDSGTNRNSERSRGDSHGRSGNNNKRRKHGRYSGSPRARHSRRDEYSGTEEDDDVDMDTGDDFDDADAASIHGDSDEGPLDEWGDDLMGDQKDRRWLASLNEVERERILAERQERRDMLNEQRELRLKLKAGVRVSAADEDTRSSRVRRTNREAASRGPGGSAFSDLKRARERKRRGASGHWSSYSGSEGEDEEEGEPEHAASLEEINSICLTRNQLEQWLFKPFLAKTVIGCFVRIVTRTRDSTGEYNQYKVMEITDVVQGEGRDQPPYHLNKTLTDRYLTLRYGATEKDYSMETISNSPIKAEEFEKWESTMHTERVRARLSTETVNNKLQDLEAAKNYQLSEADVNNIIAERNRLRRIGAGTTGGITAIERAQLNQLRIEAQQSGDWEQLKKIEAKLAEMDKTLTPHSKGEGRAALSTTTGHKSLLAPSSVRQGNVDKGSIPTKRSRLLTPSSNRRAASSLATSSKGGVGFALVPAIDVQELSLRSKITPGYIQMMANNGGYDMSFLKL
ncbi:RNA polymerase-associated protein rtf1 [Coemansia spiralis]|uniref:RNA polymerase-associated protein rtf1 n=2 Tax=Coemansia TaxID=4863 RepID=A0A9W8G2N1_9FUNG|nr:hypothetical protein BX070DRAFT_231709 [Coemansia spiralis]KAJ1986224.1 RNA polymerase-associated protein rtf1 [Coemansia umbellata]KAJ2618655.1 RNA polymerase-associated protein rtf1 [Coemansia sp. RSA 1358]KAJ2668668.1 RNA polymerase-associated protein rtf1 [Coemansia spiralis]